MTQPITARTSSFTWKPLYMELARKLPAWRTRQGQLIAILQVAKTQGVPVSELQDEDKNGKRFPLQVMDPFTFFAFFNRKTKEEHRLKLLSIIKDKLGLESPLPADFEGLPVMNPLKTWFFSYEKNREPDAIETLWDFAEAIVKQSPDAIPAELYSRCRNIKQVGLPNLTMGLFWMRPDQYLALDSLNRALLKKHGINVDVEDWPAYLELLARVKEQFPGISWPELSHKAYEDSSEHEEEPRQDVNEARRVWKIAPGEGAYLWKQFREHGYIGIGWLGKHDLRKFKTNEALLKALNENDHGPGAASSIDSFVHELKPGDVIVANKGREGIVGIGVVADDGDYEYNPDLADQTEMEYPHLRKVEWVIQKPVDSPVHFGQQPPTVKELSDSDLEKICAAYRERYPNDPDLIRAIESLSPGTKTRPEPSLPSSRLAPNRSLNWIYYGPPGTGKTWSVLHEVRQFLLVQNGWTKESVRYAELRDKNDDASKTERQRLTALLEGAGEQKETRYWWVTASPSVWTWDELFRKKAEVFSRGRIRRNYEEVAEGDLVFGYTSWPKKELTAMARVKRLVPEGKEQTFELEPVQRIDTPIGWAELKEHPTLKQAEPVRFRAQGTLFKLEETEAAELERLLRAKGNDLKFSVKASPRYFEFVTFHQSYSYEDFVEGLRPVSDADGNVRYEVKDGVFKRLCRRAQQDVATNGHE